LLLSVSGSWPISGSRGSGSRGSWSSALRVILNFDLSRDTVGALHVEVHDDLLATLRCEPGHSTPSAGDLGFVVVLELLFRTIGRLDRQHLCGRIDAGEFATGDLRLRLRLGCGGAGRWLCWRAWLWSWLSGRLCAWLSWPWLIRYLRGGGPRDQRESQQQAENRNYTRVCPGHFFQTPLQAGRAKAMPR